MEKTVQFAADFGIPLIQLAGYDTYYEQGSDQTRAWFVENLYRAAEFAARAGVLLGFETMWAHPICRFTQTWGTFPTRRS